MALQELDAIIVAVHLRHRKRCLSLRVRLVHTDPELEHVLKQLLAAISGCIMESTVASGINSERVCSVVQQQLNDSNAVCANCIAQGRDTLHVLRVNGYLLVQELLHCPEVTVFGGLVEVERCLLDLLQSWLQLLWQASHLLADLQHQVLILSVLHDGLHAILLDVFKNCSKLWIALQTLQLLLHGLILRLHFVAVVLSNSLGLKPSSHRVRVASELLQVPSHCGIGLQIGLHLIPCRIVNIWDTGNVQRSSVIEGDGLARWSLHLGCHCAKA
mmetsp:Transcript_48286/g.114832  ORF Transcript_48286/g.114832 Transcript_48286/m.114832 type:complete len:273 (+) Transcript_48286:67-885(+)